MRLEGWKLQLAPRWEAIRAKGALLGWDRNTSLHIYQIANFLGMKWFANRSSDRVSDFMSFDSYSFFNHLPCFGRTKCVYLIEILEAATCHIDSLEFTFDRTNHLFAKTCAEVLTQWEVPFDYPLKLVLQSPRLLGFCEDQNITSLHKLIEAWAMLGRAAILAQRNIGRRSVDELEDLVNAIAHSDAASARRWLPLKDNEKGLCLWRALELANKSHSEIGRAVIMLRIVEGCTLEETGQELGITRERVRQIEFAYMQDVEHTLKAFHNERQSMLDAWMNELDWKIYVKPICNTNSEILIHAAIESSFYKSPQGMARRLATESSLNTCIENAMNHPDLHLKGFDLQNFLDNEVPIKLQEIFIGKLATKPALVIDYATGLVRPSTKARNILLCRD